MQSDRPQRQNDSHSSERVCEPRQTRDDEQDWKDLEEAMRPLNHPRRRRELARAE